jgi:hypothetical protein
MLKSLVSKIKKIFKKKAKNSNIISPVFEKIVESHLDHAEKVAEKVDESLKEIEEVVLQEVKEVKASAKKTPAKKSPAEKKTNSAAPKPKGRPKKNS